MFTTVVFRGRARCVWCLSLLLLCVVACPALAQVTVLLPDQPTREENPKDKLRQMDVLLALLEPFSYTALPMEMPQRLAVLRTVPTTKPAAAAPPAAADAATSPDASQNTNTTAQNSKDKAPYSVHSEELLGDLEEIRYLGEKSWATHVALQQAGLYTLLAETRPRYNAERKIFEQHLVKTMLPVYGIDNGWYAPAGLPFEILPLTRPFGLMAPAALSGQVLLANKPLVSCTVTALRLNTTRRGIPSPWHEKLITRTNSAGEFTLVCPVDGWWCFVATAQADAPLKGPDNTPTALEISAILWVYVDSATNASYKVPRPAKEK